VVPPLGYKRYGRLSIENLRRGALKKSAPEAEI
jgi:hypothetical protein